MTSKEKAISVLYGIRADNLNLDDAYTKDKYDALTLAIKALEREPKIGHWDDIPKYKDIAWQCSECGHFTTMKHNFCADCGCRMVEPQESEEI